jgi:hypothetical protein
MRRASLLSLAVFGLAAAACSTATPAPPSENSAAGAPQPVAGYDWFLSTDGSQAKLAYGAERSDDLKLSLECTSGTGLFDLTASAADGAAPEIHLESGGDTERYSAQAEPAVVHDGLVLTAQARSDTPVFQRFRRVGWMAAWHGNIRETYVPQPASAGRIEQFFALCTRGSGA